MKEKDHSPGLAKSRFNEGFNCAQSVFSVFAKEEGLDENAAYKIASAFGGGINSMGKTCGAVTGALMSLGLKEGRTIAVDDQSKEKLAADADKFLKLFSERYGSIDCRDLLDQVRKEDPSADEYKNCPVYVEGATRMIRDIL